MAQHKLTGNQFWKLRSVHGRTAIFGGDGTTLRLEACLFFDWCDRNPWKRDELVKFQGMADNYTTDLGRPYTMDGLTVYLNVAGSYFRTAKDRLIEKIEAKRNTEDEVLLLETIEWIEAVVRTQQYEGAMLGVFNPNFTARMNGMADNVNQHTTSDPVIRVNVKDQQTADDLDALNDLL